MRTGWHPVGGEHGQSVEPRPPQEQARGGRGSMAPRMTAGKSARSTVG